MHGCMHHHVAHPIANGLNVAFSNRFLMFCTNTREGLGLILGDAVITKHTCVINAVVTVEVLDSNTCKILTHLFKPCLSHDCLACSHTGLAFHIDKIGGSIRVKCTPVKTALRAITVITIQTASRSVNDELICEDLISRFILIELEDAILCRNGTRGLDIGWAKFLRREATCKTPWY
jgi:hypothetical protein